MPNIVDIENSEKYTWGDQCLGWHLVKREELSVIQEEVPPGKSEKRHYHKVGRQFFYILNGEAVMEIEGNNYTLRKNQGIQIEPKDKHKFKNESGENVQFLVVTMPKIVGDRVDVE